MVSLYELYKPFRNYMRGFPVVESLQQIWLFGSHLSGSGPHSAPLRFADRIGPPITLKGVVYLWDLEVLAREVVLNADNSGPRSFARWSDFARAATFIRDIDNEIAKQQEVATVLRELHRLVHRQFPWQRPPSASSTIRNLKIFGGSELEPAMEKQAGLPIKHFFLLAFHAAGHFIGKSGMSTQYDYRDLGISHEERDAFFRKFTVTLPALREQTRRLQVYDDRWLYTWNPLQSTPLVSFDPTHPERVICPIPSYLVRRATDGLFYDLVNTPGFDNAFGAAFQNYVGLALKEILKSPQFEVFAEQPYALGKGYRKHGVDWTVTDATANLFIECKAKRLRRDAKFETSGTGLYDAIDTMGGYVVQHYKNVTDALEGKTAWQKNDKPCFAIIVTLEDWWIFTPPIVAMLDEAVDRHLEIAGIPKDILERVPFTVASIDELEIASQVMAETGFASFLMAKAEAEHRGWAVSPFTTSRFPEQAKRAHRRLFAEEFLNFGKALADQGRTR